MKRTRRSLYLLRTDRRLTPPSEGIVFRPMLGKRNGSLPPGTGFYIRSLGDLIVSCDCSDRLENHGRATKSRAIHCTMAPHQGPIFSMGFMWWSANNPPEDPRSSFAGKTILITGANVGLGFETFVKFAALGASRIILGMRSLERGATAKAEVCRRTGYDPNNIAMYVLDMSTFKGVNKFCSEVMQHEPRVDIAVLNAGMGAPRCDTSPDGYELCLQVNVLSTALLAALLLPKLRASSKLSSSPSHLEIVGSNGNHFITPAHLGFPPEASVLDKVSEPKYFDPKLQYCLTKLFAMYVMEGLVQAQERHGGADEVIISTACPGLCRSNMGREFPKWQQVFDSAFKRVMARSPEEGSRTIVSGVTLGKEAHGQMWAHDSIYRLVLSPKSAPAADVF